MNQASQMIASQYRNGELVKRGFGEAFYISTAFDVFPESGNVTDQLQALVDQAKAEGRSAIFFPAGQYYVTDLQNTEGIYFFGDNASFVGGYTGVINQVGAPPVIDTTQDKPSMLYKNAIDDIASKVPGNSLKAAVNAAKSGSLRIMFVGDSITYGADQLSYSDSYPAKVETAIRAALTGISITTANYSLGSRRLAELMNPNFKGMASPPVDPLQGFSEPWSTIGKSWLNSVKDFAPDLLIVAFGMNDTYATPTNADSTDANLYISLLIALKSWSYTPSTVFVTNMLPTKDQSRGFVVDQKIMQSIARASREVGLVNAVPVADANRLYNVLVNGTDEAATLSVVESNFAGYVDDLLWSGNKNEFTLSSGTLTPNDINPKLVTRLKDFYSGKIEMDVKFVNASDTLWLYYRSYDAYGSLILLVTPNGSGNGQIGIYVSDSGTALVDVGGLDIPFNAFRNIRLEVNGSRHIVYLAGTKVIDIVLYNKLHSGVITIGSQQSPPIMANLKLTYADPSTVSPAYTEDDILGKFNSQESGNGLNHPSSLGHAMVYFPAFDGIIRTLATAMRSNDLIDNNMKVNIATGAQLDLFSFIFSSGSYKSVFVEIITSGLFQGIGTRIVTTTYQLLWQGSSGSFSQVSNNAFGSGADALSHVTTPGAVPKIAVATVGTADGSDLKSTIRIIGDGCRVNPL